MGVSCKKNHMRISKIKKMTYTLMCPLIIRFINNIVFLKSIISAQQSCKVTFSKSAPPQIRNQCVIIKIIAGTHLAN